MTGDRAQLVKRIFLEAVELRDEARAEYLDVACSGDALLRADVERLLSADLDLPSDFLGPSKNIDRPLPERIGPFRVLRRLGEGGMGTVFEAEQDHPRRRVALKIIRGASLSESLRRRFEYEVQALGRLRHPGIAHLYQAGIHNDGAGEVPYFAMEYVDGEPLHTFARRRSLDARQCLVLMGEVCDAVQHAHQNGVIHRDLKPANILVEETEGGAPRPRVRDFGVARVLAETDPRTVHTEPGQLIGTLAYMSPEQVMGGADPVDTRTDVYALGLILYELLSGGPPYDVGRSSMAEAARRICSEEPLPLGRVNRQFRGDVETMVAKALEKERDRRYQSAAELAEDIRRCLRNEPIAALPPSAAYQLRKFTKRHKALVGGVLAVFVTLIAGVAGTSTALWQAHASKREAVQRTLEAERAAARAEAINRFIQDMLSSVDPALALGREVTIREALELAAARIDAGDMRDQPEIEAELRKVIGNTYLALGHLSPAEAHLEKAVLLRRQVHGESSVEFARSQIELAMALHQEGRHAEEESRLRHALHVLRMAGGADLDVASCLQALGASLRNQHRLDEAEPHYRESLAIRRRLLGDRHGEVAQSLNSLALLHQNRGEYAEAESLFREALAVRREFFAAGHPLVADAMSNLANLLQIRGRFDEAEELLREALDLRRSILGASHPRLGESANSLAFLLYERGRWAEAEPLYEEAIQIWRRSLPPGHLNLANALAGLGLVLTAQGDYARAVDLLREAVAIREAALPGGHWSRLTARSALGAALAGLGEFAEAESLLLSSYEGLRDDPYVPPRRKEDVLAQIVALYETWGRPEHAAEWRQRAATSRPPDPMSTDD